jgi:23S rRNA (cytosine1962-C5)-methyltransferase
MITLKVKRERVGPVFGRHPWVFSGALGQIPDGLESGAPVRLEDEAGNFLAQGYFNSYSQIAVRVWSWDAGEEVNDDFFVRRIKNALELRQNYLADKKTDAYRLINSENDFLPGLIADRYGDYICLQFHTRGIEYWKENIISALRKVLKPKGIYERSDVRTRGIEGAPKQAGLLWGKVPEKIKITENGYRFWVDIIAGQKTGFFLDQRDKRAALEKYVKGKKVLNCFSYTGGFSVYALGAGAKRVVSVDASESAIKLAEENITLNKQDLKKCAFACEDVKNYLFKINQEASKEEFDVIVLDPPAFVKDRHKINEGLIGYKKINEMALRVLEPGGILATCSCSAHVSMLDFRHVLSEAAGRARRTVQILETYTHGIDHPELVAFTEGEYLKCIFARVA